MIYIAPKSQKRIGAQHIDEHCLAESSLFLFLSLLVGPRASCVIKNVT